jgi:hypothetical protein
MQMTLRYPDGRRRESLLLAANPERMRVVIESQRDTVELHQIDSRWFTEEGAEVEIEALLAIPGTDVTDFCSEVYPQTMSA